MRERRGEVPGFRSAHPGYACLLVFEALEASIAFETFEAIVAFQTLEAPDLRAAFEAFEPLEAISAWHHRFWMNGGDTYASGEDRR